VRAKREEPRRVSVSTPARALVHIPSREPTKQFLLPAARKERSVPRGESTRPFPLASPTDIPVPLARLAPAEIAMPLANPRPAVDAPVVFARTAASSAWATEDGDDAFDATPSPFSHDDPEEDLLAPYARSPIHSVARILAKLTGR
jgi:hypothetical protein